MYEIITEDVIFVWNESGNYIESIMLNTQDLALDINKNYRVCIEEVPSENNN